ncbi:MAG: hypothetical protein V4722_21800 [Bacteroidota bacterium]
MKIYLLITVLFLSLFRNAAAQEKPEPYEGTEYGAGATITTTVTTDQKLNKIVTVVIRDKDKTIRQTDTWTNNVKGNWSLEVEVRSVGGKTTCKCSYIMDENKNVVRYETWFSGSKSIFVRAASGELHSIDGGGKFPEQEEMEKRIKEDLKEIGEKTIPSLEPHETACSKIPGGECQAPKTRVFAGYSFLTAFADNKTERFPLGGHASFIFNPGRRRIGVGIDASVHTKKINDENLARYFVLGIGSWYFGDLKKCDRTFRPDLHILAGWGGEKYGMSKGSGFAFGGGPGLEIKLSKHIGIKAQADYITVKFAETDAELAHMRGTVGAVYW